MIHANIHVQYPICDLRQLILSTKPSPLYPLPNWDDPVFFNPNLSLKPGGKQIERHFVKYFGAIYERLVDPPIQFSDEKYYANAQNGVKFEGLRQLKLGPFTHVKGYLRRLFFNQHYLARLEIAMRCNSFSEVNKFTYEDLISVLQALETHKLMRIGVLPKLEDPITILELGSPLQILYTKATSPAEDKQAVLSQAGSPAIFIQYKHSEESGFADPIRGMPDTLSADLKVKPQYYLHRHKGVSYPVWLIPSLKPGRFMHSDKESRFVRLSLMRIEAEQFVLESLLRWDQHIKSQKDLNWNHELFEKAASQCIRHIWFPDREVSTEMNQDSVSPYVDLIQHFQQQRRSSLRTKLIQTEWGKDILNKLEPSAPLGMSGKSLPEIVEIKRLLQENQLEPAVNKIEDVIDGYEEFKNEFLTQISSYHRVKNDALRGWIDADKYREQLNKIRDAMLRLIQNMATRP